ncbi:hypothetical protein [Deinococcus aquatilis]|uniref:hypothetical protein n=1 Tax=Deinococcus aquatilis TaxID=519440 RepID=UPI000373E06E|nr:hypothetical protein [Deinococcus aquatilis]
MLSLGDLLNPLALSGKCEDPAHRQVLMRSVLQLMIGRAGPWPHDDPVWASLLPLIPQATNRSTGLNDTQHLTLSVPFVLPANQLGQLVRLPWLIGDECMTILGEVIWHQPLTVQVRRESYEQARQPIPAFLQAYNGLRRLGVTAAEAQTLTEHAPTDLLLEVISLTARRQISCTNPIGSVQALLTYRLTRRARTQVQADASKCGHKDPAALPHSTHVHT